MKVEIMAVFTADHMPNIEECEQICAEDGVKKFGNSAVEKVVRDLIESDGLYGIAEQARITQVVPVEVSKTF